MIDVGTGVFVVDGQHAVGPGLTRSGFLASPLGAGAQSEGGAAGWVSFALGVHEVAGDRCWLVLRFHDERLVLVVLGVIADVPPGDEYDVDAALEAKARYDAWLQAKLGAPPYAYPWGRVESSYDPRSVSSSIVVTYDARP
jgi:hypothetical protein